MHGTIFSMGFSSLRVWCMGFCAWDSKNKSLKVHGIMYGIYAWDLHGTVVVVVLYYVRTTVLRTAVLLQYSVQ